MMLRDFSRTVLRHTLMFAVLLTIGCCFIALAHRPLVAAELSLANRIQPLIERHDGLVSVAIKHLQTGDGFQHDAKRVMPTASLIKFPIMIEAYRQIHTESSSLKRSCRFETKIVFRARVYWRSISQTEQRSACATRSN